MEDHCTCKKTQFATLLSLWPTGHPAKSVYTTYTQVSGNVLACNKLTTSHKILDIVCNISTHTVCIVTCSRRSGNCLRVSWCLWPVAAGHAADRCRPALVNETPDRSAVELMVTERERMLTHTLVHRRRVTVHFKPH